MTEFRGTYFDGESSRGHPVVATAENGRLRVQGEGCRVDVSLEDCTVEPALGATRRSLYTPDGGRLDTWDAEAFCALEGRRNGSWILRLARGMESRWKSAVAGVAALLLIVWGAAAHGLPALARAAAFALPSEIVEPLGRTTLEQVDGVFLKPSQLEPERQEEIRRSFRSFTAPGGTGEPYELIFRRSRAGPNAFALPHGVVVLTDQMVDFVESEDELLGVLAHETAHLECRHGLRSVLQNAGVFVLVSALVGDVVSVTSIAGALPTVLLESRYSRSFEEEADRLAADRMLASGRGVEPMIAFLERMGSRFPIHRGPDLVSTHPAVQKRIAYLRSVAEETGR